MSQLFSDQMSGLHGLDWHSQHAGVPVVALHGWLDNAASFSALAPLLSNHRIIALDLPGHGKSPWKGADADYSIWGYTDVLWQVCQQFGQPIHLLSHSMGSATAMFLSAAFPELVKSVVMLDAAGPLTTPEDRLANQLLEGVLAQQQLVRPSRKFADFDQALSARLRGSSVLTGECIGPVVERNLQPAVGGEPGELEWSTDPRLRLASRLRLTESQVRATLAAIKAPVMAIRAADGLIPEAMFKDRLGVIDDCRFVECSGHHHFHLDASTAPAIAECMSAFWLEVEGASA